MDSDTWTPGVLDPQFFASTDLIYSFHPWAERCFIYRSIYRFRSNCWKIHLKTGGVFICFCLLVSNCCSACVHVKKKRLFLLQCFYCDIDMQKKSIKDSSTAGCKKEGDAAVFSHWVSVLLVKGAQHLPLLCPYCSSLGLPTQLGSGAWHWPTPRLCSSTHIQLSSKWMLHG